MDKKISNANVEIYRHMLAWRSWKCSIPLEGSLLLMSNTDRSQEDMSISMRHQSMRSNDYVPKVTRECGYLRRPPRIQMLFYECCRNRFL